MLKFTFLLQHHVRHRLPYAPLIFTHVVESLVFVPIMVSTCCRRDSVTDNRVAEADAQARQNTNPPYFDTCC